MYKYLKESHFHLRLSLFTKDCICWQNTHCLLPSAFLIYKVSGDALQRYISYLERTVLFKEQIMTLNVCLFQKCAFSHEIAGAVCSSVASAKQPFLLLNSCIFSLQSLPSENCTGSEGTVREVGCTTVKHTSSHVENAKQCPGAILVVRDFMVPSTPSAPPRSWLSYSLPVVAAPLAWAAWSHRRGSGHAKEAKTETFPE